MKLFFVIYTGAGLIGGSVGPLPYGMDECEHRAALFQAEADAKPEVSQGIHFVCEWRPERPKLEE